MRVWWLLVVAALGAGTVQAQEAPMSFIVRLDDAAPEALRGALRSTPAGRQAASPALFAGVSAAQPVLTDRPGKAAPFAAFVLSCESEAACEQALAAWKDRPDVAYAHPNYLHTLDGVAEVEQEASADAARAMQDAPLDSLDHLPVIRAPEAWEVTRGEGALVGVVDTGVLLDHPALDGQLWSNPGEIPGNGIDDDGNGYVDDVVGYDFVDRTGSVLTGDYRERDSDPSEGNVPGGGYGHGTLVSGALLAELVGGAGGVAPEARLVVLRAFGPDGRAEDDDVAAAIVYAADQGIDVLNLSFGDTYRSPLMHEAIRYAEAQGVVLVASGGNTGGDDPHFPSDYPEVLSVVWLTADGEQPASRATSGVGTDLGAPGTAIFTTRAPAPDGQEPPEEDDFYMRASGSSLAAPLVSGAAALLRSHDPSLSPASVRAILTASARDLLEPGWDARTGAGRLDAADALARALPARIEITTPRDDRGVAGGELAVVGSALDPSFASYSLFVAPGDEVPFAWQPLAEGIDRQVLRDTLGVWDTNGFEDGVHTLRLMVELRSGGTVEERRRVYLDATPPNIALSVLAPLIEDGRHGVAVEAITDDLVEVRLRVEQGGRAHVVDGDRLARRHGLRWRDEDGDGGEVLVRVVATNMAGLTTTVSRPLSLPTLRANPSLFEGLPLGAPAGYTLERFTDFDGDGLQEVVMNRLDPYGAFGDSLQIWEWDGEGLQPAFAMVANVLPRDVGDTDGDGLDELLTQVGGATLLLEQPQEDAFPSRPAYVDTLGLRQPSDSAAAWGGALADLDEDGRGEILAHNQRYWRVLEARGTGDATDYVEVDRFLHTFGPEAMPDTARFSVPGALATDLDGDGSPELVVGTSEGDVVVYEAEADDRYREVWSYATGRHNAGTRFAAGDFDGDGVPGFVAFSQPFLSEQDGEYDAHVGIYYRFEAEGDGFALRSRVAVWGEQFQRGAVTAYDVDRDGRDEVILSHAPDLFVLDWEADAQIAYHAGLDVGTQPTGVFSHTVIAGDLDGDRRADLVASLADGTLHRFAFRGTADAGAEPVWVASHPLGPDAVRLAWSAAGADSVTVFAGEASLDPVATVTGDTLDVVASDLQTYALAAWRGGERSPVNTPRTFAPRALAMPQDVQVLAPLVVRVRWSEPLADTPRASAFTLRSGTFAATASAALVQEDGRLLVLSFHPEDVPRGGGTAALEITHDIRDRDGAPLGRYVIEAIELPSSAEAALFVAEWQQTSEREVALRFNLPVDPTTVDAGRLAMTPTGRVVGAEVDAEDPQQVLVSVEGVALGATGLRPRLTVDGITAADGSTLTEEGRTVLLARAASNLADVYAFPNPYDASRHMGEVTVAGLPQTAQVTVLTATGVRVRMLEEADGDGGVQWDLRDEAGSRVPSGVYLLRIEADDEEPVLRKVAVVR